MLWLELRVPIQEDIAHGAIEYILVGGDTVERMGKGVDEGVLGSTVDLDDE